MRVATWNVNGIRARESQFAEWAAREAPDVICLQELKSPREKIPPALAELPGYWCYWHGETAYSGVGLHLKKSFFGEKPSFSHPAFDHETRIVAARSSDLLFASIYVPNGGKNFEDKIRFLRELERFAARCHDEKLRVVLCGDLNVARAEIDVHPKERKAVIGQLPEERELLAGILGRGLIDVGRALDPGNENLFTWWPPWRQMRQRNIGWRLDYLLASESAASSASACAVFPGVGTSDHAPVVGSFELS